MGKIRVAGFTISLDGYGAGPNQTREVPLGVGGEALHAWMFPTRTFRRMTGKDDGTTGVDDDFAASSMANVGAWIMGRNMFAASRGPWPDDGWKGWWGKSPPYHCPVYVLTHYPHPPIEMEGGTVFHFVTDGIGEALRRAQEVAGDKDVRLGGGVSTLQQYLRERLIDELHLAISPMLLGSGERLFEGLDAVALGYECVEQKASPAAMHVVLRKTA
jgi:dihydrofolate reductase